MFVVACIYSATIAMFISQHSSPEHVVLHANPLTLPQQQTASASMCAEDIQLLDCKATTTLAAC
jgi:hypothetical protein